MKPLTLQRLQVFCAVYETVSISAAARRMGLSQPTVSRHLRDFEAALKLPLFVLEKGRLIPTAEADAIYSESRFLNDGMSRLDAQIAALRKGMGSRLSVMAVGLLTPHFVPEAIRALLADMPELQVSVDVGTLDQQLQVMRAGQVDIGIVAGRVLADDVHLERIGQGRLVVLLPRDWPLAAQRSVDLPDLHGHPMLGLTPRGPIGRVLAQVMSDRGLSFETKVTGNSNLAAPHLASALRAAVVTDEFTARLYPAEGLIAVPLEPRIPFDIYAMTAAPSASTLAARDFVRHMKGLLDAWRRGVTPGAGVGRGEAG